jgi:hypothetical protein
MKSAFNYLKSLPKRLLHLVTIVPPVLYWILALLTIRGLWIWYLGTSYENGVYDAENLKQ